jgi:hypothetical protein
MNIQVEEYLIHTIKIKKIFSISLIVSLSFDKFETKEKFELIIVRKYSI